MELPIESQRLKSIRKELSETQASFAEKLGIGQTTTEYERGRTKLSGVLVMKLLQEYQINPLWLYGESEQKHLNPNSLELGPKMLSVDSIGHENILMVNEKAAAGYAGNLNNPEYYEELPAFSFPLPEYRNATFRGFQVEGLSMLPSIQPNEWIIAKAIGGIEEIKEGKIYIIVDSEGIRIKQVSKHAENRMLVLSSINPEYSVSFLNYEDVKEIWEFHSKISQELVIDSQSEKLDAIYRDVKEIKKRVIGD